METNNQPQSQDVQSQDVQARELAQKEHFRQKAEWKRKSGNHFLPEEPTPMDGFELATEPQADLVLDWA